MQEEFWNNFARDCHSLGLLWTLSGHSPDFLTHRRRV